MVHMYIVNMFNRCRFLFLLMQKLNMFSLFISLCSLFLLLFVWSSFKASPVSLSESVICLVSCHRVTEDTWRPAGPQPPDPVLPLTQPGPPHEGSGSLCRDGGTLRNTGSNKVFVWKLSASSSSITSIFHC